jgi:hypothetical protein
VHVYADPDWIKRRFPEKEIEGKNIFVLRPDPHLRKVSKNNAASLAQIYADLWQIGGATGDRFVLELEKKLEPKPSDVLKALTQR